MLKTEGFNTDNTIGKLLLNDPDDFNDYIHFQDYDTMHVEYVILSRQKNKMITEPDVEYMPGTRIYLDNHKIINDGLMVRDGLHKYKVKDELDLNKYMITVIEGFKVRETWTPKGFSDYATTLFERSFVF